MVITLDFESSDPGSNPGRTCFRSLDSPPWLSWQSARLLTDRSLVRAQVEALPVWVLSSAVEHRIADPQVTGSIPVVPF